MRLLQILGVMILVSWLAGSVGLIDFQLCIKLSGQCTSPSSPSSASK